MKRVISIILSAAIGLHSVSACSAATVFHIQDIHGNPEAQRNIERILERLISNGKIDFIALEGAFTEIDLGRFRRFPRQQAVWKTADYFLKEKWIAGPVHFALRRVGDIPPFIGVDDPDKYPANIAAYRSARERVREEKRKLTHNLRRVQAIKRMTLNPALARVDFHVQAYRDKRLPLAEYLSYLGTITAVYPQNADDFVQASRLERLIDFNRLKQDPSQSQNVSRYLELTRRVDGRRLYRDAREMERAAYAATLRTEQERRVIEISDQLHLIGKLLDFSLNREEWSEYKGLSSDRRPALTPFEAFYRIAEERDRAIAENLLDNIRAQGAGTVILITGGFHSEGILKRLRDSGVEVIPLTPRVKPSVAATGTGYLDAFLRDKAQTETLSMPAFPRAMTDGTFGTIAAAVDKKNGAKGPAAAYESLSIPEVGAAPLFLGGNNWVMALKNDAGGAVVSFKDDGDVGNVRIWTGALHQGTLADLLALVIMANLKKGRDGIMNVATVLDEHLPGFTDIFIHPLMELATLIRQKAKKSVVFESSQEFVEALGPYQLPLNTILPRLIRNVMGDPKKIKAKKNNADNEKIIRAETKRLAKAIQKGMKREAKVKAPDLKEVKVELFTGQSLIFNSTLFILAPIVTENKKNAPEATLHVNELLLKSIAMLSPATQRKIVATIVRRETGILAKAEPPTSNRSKKLFQFIHMILNRKVLERQFRHLDEITHDISSPININTALGYQLEHMAGDKKLKKISRKAKKLFKKLENIEAGFHSITMENIGLRKNDPRAFKRNHFLFYPRAGMLIINLLSLNKRMHSPDLSKLIRDLRRDINADTRAAELLPLVNEIAANLESGSAMIASVDKFLEEGRYIGSPTPVDMVDVARAAAARFELENFTVQITQKGPDAPIVDADRDHLLRAFDNMFRNAKRHSTKKNGARQMGRANVIVEKQGWNVQLTFEDNGSGIDGDLLRDNPDKPDPLWSSGVSGAASSGLGLSITRDIIAAARGQVRADHEFKDGARFVIDFPYSFSKTVSELNLSAPLVHSLLKSRGIGFNWNRRRDWNSAEINVDRNGPGLSAFMDAWRRVKRRFPGENGGDIDGWRSFKFHSFSYRMVDRTLLPMKDQGDIIKYLQFLFADPALGPIKIEIDRLAAAAADTDDIEKKYAIVQSALTFADILESLLREPLLDTPADLGLRQFGKSMSTPDPRPLSLPARQTSTSA